MRHATPEERIAALRRLRSENEASDSFAEQGGSVGNTFSRRISRAFGGSRGGSRRASGVLTSRPVSEVPHNAAEPAAPTMTNMGPPIAEVTSHGTVEPSPAAEVTSPEGVSHPTAEATDSTATETDGTPQPATQTETETSPGTTPHIGSETEHHNSESTAAEGTSPETNAR